MIRREELYAAAAVCASVAGAGFASGREIDSFFTRLGPGSWLGVASACAAAGALTAVLLELARQTQAASFPALFGRLMDNRCRDVMRLMYGLMLLMTGAAMIAAAGELGALTFEMPLARLVGAAVITLAAAAFASSGLRPLGLAGLLMTAATGVVYRLLAGRGRTAAAFSAGGLALSLPMGLLYAAFNISLAAGLITAASREAIRPRQTGLLTAFLMALMLVPANRALLGAEERVRQAALPAVVLAGQWSCAGYYVMIALMALAVVTTLSALFVAARDQLSELGMPPALTLPAAILAASLLSACGFEMLVNTVYPLLGWACALALTALLFCLPRKKR